MPSKREGRAVRLNRSTAAILPVDWVRWNGIKPGDLLEIEYDGEVQIRSVKRRASADGGRNPAGPASTPAQPAETDEGGLVDDGS
jgi:bifunctional DNA-binding transcriptional regulator/antitoxin component of YhaV-PrlF toxin-antitoxin module